MVVDGRRPLPRQYVFSPRKIFYRGEKVGRADSPTDLPLSPLDPFSFRAISFEFRTRAPCLPLLYYSISIRNSKFHRVHLGNARAGRTIGDNVGEAIHFPPGPSRFPAREGIGETRGAAFREAREQERGKETERGGTRAGSCNFIKAPSPDISNKTSIAENRVTSWSHQGRLFRELFPTWKEKPVISGNEEAGRERGQLLTSLDFIPPSNFPGGIECQDARLGEKEKGRKERERNLHPYSILIFSRETKLRSIYILREIGEKSVADLLIDATRGLEEVTPPTPCSRNKLQGWFHSRNRFTRPLPTKYTN